MLDVLSPKLKTPYSEQAEVAIERQLSRDWVVTVSGIFSRGVNLYGTEDINAPALGAPFTYTLSGAPSNFPATYTTQVYNTTVRPNPNFGAILLVFKTTDWRGLMKQAQDEADKESDKGAPASA